MNFRHLGCLVLIFALPGCNPRLSYRSSPRLPAGTRDARLATPLAPVILSPTTSPYVSAVSQLTLAGRCDSGADVQLHLPGGATRSAPCAAGAFSFSVNANLDGSFVYGVSQSVAGGGASDVRSLTWIRSAATPAAPALEGPAEILTSLSQITLKGSCAAGHTVLLGGAASQSAGCAGGRFSFDVSQSRDGNYVYALTQKSASGVISDPLLVRLTLDTAAPDSLVLLEPAGAALESAGSEFRLAGECEPGSQIQISGDLGVRTAVCDGNFSSVFAQDVDGTYRLQAKQVDAAGNASPAVSVAWIRDTSVPALPTLTQPADARSYSHASTQVIAGGCTLGMQVVLTGASAQQQICSSGQFRFEVPGTEDGERVYSLSQRSRAGVSSQEVQLAWVRDTLAPALPSFSRPVSNPSISGGNQLLLSGACESLARLELQSSTEIQATQCVNGVYSFTVLRTVDATYDFQLRQVDLAGNISSTASFQWVRDTSTPAKPVLASPGANPYLSRDSLLSIAGTCQEGYAVSLIRANQEVMSAVCQASTFRFEVAKATDGAESFGIQQVNPFNGNISAQEVVTWIRDTVPPAALEILSPLSGSETSVGPLVVSGNCEPAAAILLTGDTVGEATCSTAGNFSFSIQKAVDGTYQFSVKQQDLAGNFSDVRSVSWIKASPAVSPPVILSPSLSLIANNLGALTVSGTCLPDHTVLLDVQTPAPAGSPLAVPTYSESAAGSPGLVSQACAANGIFQLQAPGVSDGTLRVSLSQSLGERKSASVSFLWTRDSTAPNTALTVKPVSPNRDLQAAFQFTATETLVTFECQLDSAVPTACASPFVLPTVSNGTHTFSVRARDLFGNVDPTPAQFTWVQSAFKTLALYHGDSTPGILIDSGLSDEKFPLQQTGVVASSSARFLQGPDFSAATPGALSSASTFRIPQGRTFSFEAFIRLRTIPASGRHVKLFYWAGSGADDLGMEIRLYGSNGNCRLSAVVSLDGRTQVEVTSRELGACEDQIDKREFQHIAVTWSLGQVRFWYRGSSAGSATVGTAGVSQLRSPQGPFRLGSSPTGDAFDGVMDEVRISQEARTYSGNPPSAAFVGD